MKQYLTLFFLTGFFVFSQNVDFSVQLGHSKKIIDINFIGENQLLTKSADSCQVLWDITKGKVFNVTYNQDLKLETNNSKTHFNYNGDAVVKNIVGETKKYKSIYTNKEFQAEVDKSTVVFFSQITRKRLFKVYDEQGNDITTIEYSASHQSFYIGLKNGDLLIVNSKNGRLVKRVELHTSDITFLELIRLKIY